MGTSLLNTSHNPLPEVFNLVSRLSQEGTRGGVGGVRGGGGRVDRIFIVGFSQKEEYNKRLHLLESEIDGLMRRKVNVSTGDSTGRVLDYDLLMNEKETQIVELEKKIQNLEERLRRSGKREG